MGVAHQVQAAEKAAELKVEKTFQSILETALPDGPASVGSATETAVTVALSAQIHVGLMRLKVSLNYLIAIQANLGTPTGGVHCIQVPIAIRQPLVTNINTHVPSAHKFMHAGPLP